MYLTASEQSTAVVLNAKGQSRPQEAARLVFVSAYVSVYVGVRASVPVSLFLLRVINPRNRSETSNTQRPKQRIALASAVVLLRRGDRDFPQRIN